MKKLGFLSSVILLPAFVRAATEMVSYLDCDTEDGAQTSKMAACEIVTEDTRILESGWYAVTNDVVINTGTNLLVKGSSHLILCDGASLTITNVNKFLAAINVPVSNDYAVTNVLAIYGQAQGTGGLLATGGNDAAGIGGNHNSSCSVVKIFGGEIVSTGGSYGAGIGGGFQGDGGTLLIAGGKVSAQGGWRAPGLGGGCEGACGDITIRDGVVIARGGSGFPGVCSTVGQLVGSLTIDGGVVTLIRGPNDSSDVFGSCLADVIINGGAILALDNDGNVEVDHGMEINVGCNICISKGIFGIPLKDSWISERSCIICNSDAQTKEVYPYDVRTPAVSVEISEHKGLYASWTSGDGALTNVIRGTFFKLPKDSDNVKVLFSPKCNCRMEVKDPFVIELGTLSDDLIFGIGNEYQVPQATTLPVPYLEWNESTSNFVTNFCVDYTEVNADTTVLTNGGWYVVNDRETMINTGTNIMVEGFSHLILCDGASLTITKVGDYLAAINVSSSDDVAVTNMLAIYGQAQGTGRLAVSGSVGGAGIGSQNDILNALIGPGSAEHCGTIIINGGIVTATSIYGAGIGGGVFGNGGVVIINGGMVTATSVYGSGVGGGMLGTKCMVTINGGIVTATSELGFGIGDGMFGDGDVVTINGKPRIMIEGELVPNVSAYQNKQSVYIDYGTMSINPDLELNIPSDMTTEDFAKSINESAELKLRYLAPPNNVATTMEYLNCFTAVPSGETKVRFVLGEQGTNAVAQAEDEAKAKLLATILATVSDEKPVTLVIENPLKGFYYCLVQQEQLMDAVDVFTEEKLAGADSGESVSLDVRKWLTSGFYRLMVSPTPISVLPLEGVSCKNP